MNMHRLDPPIQRKAILAERLYQVVSAGRDKNIRVAVGFPERTQDGGFECRAEIADENQCIVRPMRGRDAFESLMLALLNIGIELPLFSDLSADRFTWLDGQEKGLRFPALPDSSLNAVVEGTDD